MNKAVYKGNNQGILIFEDIFGDAQNWHFCLAKVSK